MQPTPSPTSAYTIGQLCVGGDWACAHGDFSELRFVVERLADLMPEPLHCELIALADQCACSPQRAAARWPALREQAFRNGKP
jgi:hypothetical protein